MKTLIEQPLKNFFIFEIICNLFKRCLDDQSRLKIDVEIHHLDENQNKNIVDLKVEDVAAEMAIMNLSKALID